MTTYSMFFVIVYLAIFRVAALPFDTRPIDKIQDNYIVLYYIILSLLFKFSGALSQWKNSMINLNYFLTHKNIVRKMLEVFFYPTDTFDLCVG